MSKLVESGLLVKFEKLRRRVQKGQAYFDVPYSLGDAFAEHLKTLGVKGDCHDFASIGGPLGSYTFILEW